MQQPSLARNRRAGTSLCDVLVALVLLAATAGWTLSATAAAERAVGLARLQHAAHLRAERALAELDALPCDSAATHRAVRERRWNLQLTRARRALLARETVTLTSSLGDTIRVAGTAWCDR